MNIAFSYQVPKLLISKIGVQAASISIIGNNLAVWTPYDKKNRNSYKQVLSGGFPVDRTFSLELSLRFNIEEMNNKYTSILCV